MRKYETVVVFHPNLNKDGLEAEINKVKELLSAHGAKEIVAKPWGKREMAYPSKKQKYAQYIAFYYESDDHDAPGEAAAVFRINDQILKFQSHRIAEQTRRFKGNPRRLKRAGAEGEEDEGGEGDEERVA